MFFVHDFFRYARAYRAYRYSYAPDYRPISVLPCFAKFLERIVTDYIVNYLNDFNVLRENQYGFRRNRSPSLALVDLCDKISTVLNTLSWRATAYYLFIIFLSF